MLTSKEIEEIQELLMDAKEDIKGYSYHEAYLPTIVTKLDKMINKLTQVRVDAANMEN